MICPSFCANTEAFTPLHEVTHSAQVTPAAALSADNAAANATWGMSVVGASAPRLVRIQGVQICNIQGFVAAHLPLCVYRVSTSGLHLVYTMEQRSP